MKLFSLILSVILFTTSVSWGSSYTEFRQYLEVADKTFSAIIAKDASTLNRLFVNS